ncbi:hypothetical protein [Streptomyces sp. HPF1205]|nr:hypothetical protein [Streptomyces sp. HPF1205]
MPEDINPETEPETSEEDVEVVAHGEGEEAVESGCVINNSKAL